MKKNKPPEFVPSVSDYVSTFREIKGQMIDNQFRMLKTHYNSYCYITAATDLAMAMEYSGAGGAKLQYGKLGSMVSNALGLGSLGVITLALMTPPENYAIHEWLWLMR